MKEEWLMSGAVVPVDVETTAALVAEIHRLIDVVGGLVLKQGPDYERGFVDGMQKQSQSSVDKAVNAMAQRQWVGLTDDEIDDIYQGVGKNDLMLVREVEAKLREKNAKAQPAVPDAIGPNEDELPAYAAGWNDCRQLMLEMRKP